jgi:hypothetical protein
MMPLKLRNFFPALLLGALTATQAAPAAAAEGEADNAPPSCVNDKGEVVALIPQSHEYFESRRKHLAFSFLDKETGKPTIIYDSEKTATLSPAFRKHVLYHECSHHLNGDMSIHFPSPDVIRTRELQADCDAVVRQRHEGLSAKEFETLADDIGNAMLQRGSREEIVRMRIQNLYQCYDLE